MSDLISKKALVKAILAERDKHPLEVEERYSFGVKLPCKFNQALRGGIRKCLHLIETAPTIDAEPVRHGHWEIDETDGSYTCECGLTMWNNDLIGGNANYCPNCGAKMDEKENNNDE